MNDSLYRKIIKKIGIAEICLIIILIGSFILRIYHLGEIKDLIFDETYFVNFAKNYINHIQFFDIHPPLGKLIIASSIRIFGDTQFFWRLMPAIAGTLLIYFMYLAGKELVNKKVGLLAAFLLALDGMVLVYSRVGLIDIFMLLFILLTFYSFIKYSKNNSLSWLFLSGLFLGLAASIKYIGGLSFFMLIAIAIIQKVPFRKDWWKMFIFLAIIPAAIYLLFFLFNYSLHEWLGQTLQWHKDSFGYNFNLKESHPYGSRWWSWFLMIRPIWMYFKEIGRDIVGINGLGNPLIWWSTLVVVPWLIYSAISRQKKALIVLCSFLIFLVPWIFVRRVIFIYHALPSLLFSILGLSMLLNQILGSGQPKYRKFNYWYVGIFIGVIVFLFIYFLPIWIGLPISSESFYQKMWFRSWI